MCRGAEIGLSIVQRVAIYMVDEHIIGDPGDFSVHPDNLLFGVWPWPNESNGAEGFAFSACSSVPFVLSQAVVIVRIDDCVFSTCKRDSAKCVSIAQPTIQQNEKYHRPFKPRCYAYLDVENKLYRSLPRH